MITFTRIAVIAPGKAVAASGFAQKVVEFYKSNYDIQLEVLRPIAGNPGRIAWVGRYANLAAFDAVSVRSQTDQKYVELIATAADLFIPGSLQDEIWRSA
jgi:hypothetical protein